jgi:hypothetical protein
MEVENLERCPPATPPLHNVLPVRVRHPLPSQEATPNQNTASRYPPGGSLFGGLRGAGSPNSTSGHSMFGNSRAPPIQSNRASPYTLSGGHFPSLQE